ncbi:Uncharacterised protein [Mycobacteroides abscessus subsp. massiliense]|nr:hypothetical protein A3N96_08870 [Mycobacteroides abscessus]SKD21193.1 Uncharacterised protein [Mycobacteroides abscessus subsp. massiliense]AMU35234.1 hypothetical protein A3N98_08330 [Mycobacteroides abscessus]AMU40237.1 hypothetical protein A3N99_08660 [Mycobacteroides abscessus]AMU60225.1 hypothetical protein A3O03_08860 [Mycobacteroides abscessus]
MHAIYAFRHDALNKLTDGEPMRFTQRPDADLRSRNLSAIFIGHSANYSDRPRQEEGAWR